MLRIKFTKLTLFLITLSFFISCSKTEDTKSESAFSPPSWIIGAWTDNVSSSTKSGFKFDSTDVYMIIFGEVLETGFVAAGAVTKHLTSTDSEFSYSYPVEGTSGDTNYSGTVTNVFTKETDSTMKLTGSSTTTYVSVTETTYTKDTSL